MNFKAWAGDAALRAIKTGAQTAVGLLGANTAGLTTVGWVHVLEVAGLAAGVSILQNLATVKTLTPIVQTVVVHQPLAPPVMDAPVVDSP